MNEFIYDTIISIGVGSLMALVFGLTFVAQYAQSRESLIPESEVWVWYQGLFYITVYTHQPCFKVIMVPDTDCPLEKITENFSQPKKVGTESAKHRTSEAGKYGEIRQNNG